VRDRGIGPGRPHDPWSRRQILRTLAGGACLPGGAASGPVVRSAAASRAATRPWTIKFLFLDYWTLEVVRGFRKTLNPPVKYAGNPILQPAKPWEGRRLHLYGTVLRDPKDGLFKMWYHSSGGPDENWFLMYAVSADGYKWDRPELDHVPWNGQRSNILLRGGVHGLSVMRDEEDPDPTRLFKLIMKPHGKTAVFVYFSPDGLRWTGARQNPVIAVNSDSHIGLWRDPETRRYVCTLRQRHVDRRVARSDSSDFVTWSEPRLIVEPEPDDPPQTQTYGLQGFAYGPYTMGQIAVFSTSEKDLRWIHPDGTKDVELGHSRGGWSWHRTVRDRRFIGLGEAGAWDSQQVTPSTAPVLLKDRLVFYYNGAPFRHGGGYTWADECVGAAELRADGFVSLDASEAEGEILTRAFALREGKIFLNADATNGEVRVEVLTDTGKTVPGFELSACVPMQGDSIEHRVRWRSGPDPALIERVPIRLRVSARKAKLYSLWMPNGDAVTHYAAFREIRCVEPLADLEA
jgi:hypothetical protein